MDAIVETLLEPAHLASEWLSKKSNHMFIVLYVLVPATSFLVVRTVLTRMLQHWSWTKRDPLVKVPTTRLNDLFVRCVRAVWATHFALWSLQNASQLWGTDEPWTHTVPGVPPLLTAVALFYVWDTAALLFIGSQDFIMYAHHVGIFVAYSVCLQSGFAHMHGNQLLIGEFLVIFGVCLHWFKFFRWTSYASLIVCCGGLSVLLFIRVPTNFYLLYLVWQGRDKISEVPVHVPIILIVGIAIAFYMEFTWSSLYIRNIQRQWNRLRGGGESPAQLRASPRPSEERYILDHIKETPNTKRKDYGGDTSASSSSSEDLTHRSSSKKRQ